MARQTVTVTTMLGAYGDYSVANAADIVWTQADTSNYEEFLMREGDILLVKNTGGSAYTFTVTSVDLFGRTGDVSAYSVGAGEQAAFGPLKFAGWKQSDGKLYFQANNTAIYFGVLRAA